MRSVKSPYGESPTQRLKSLTRDNIHALLVYIFLAVVNQHDCVYGLYLACVRDHVQFLYVRECVNEIALRVYANFHRDHGCDVHPREYVHVREYLRGEGACVNDFQKLKIMYRQP